MKKILVVLILLLMAAVLFFHKMKKALARSRRQLFRWLSLFRLKIQLKRTGLKKVWRLE